MPGILLWAWNHITEEWEEVPAVVTTKRLTGTGLVIAGAHKLHWVHENPSAGDSLFDLTDDLTGAGDVEFDHFSTAREGHLMHLDPPMPFSTGIYLKVYANYTSLVFGYV